MKKRILAVLFLLIPLVSALAPAATADAYVGVRWGYYVTYASSSLQTLKTYGHDLNYVSPYYYTLKPDVSIGGQDQAQVTSLIRQNGSKVVPMIKNEARYDDFHNFLADSGSVSQAIDEIANLVSQYNYDGIHIDFEAINGADRPLLTSFMQKLSARLRPAHKLVTMALAAKYEDRTDGWAGAYDYAALAPYLDLAVVMAYDYHTVNSDPPGAVAPISWVRDVATFSASTLGKAKTVLGVPFYGYDWNVDAGPPGTSHTYPETMALASQYGGQVTYDTASQSAVLRYVKDGQHHEVWFENADSFQAKLDVIQSQNLAGFGAWRLGQEDPGVWQKAESIKPPTDPVPNPGNPSIMYFKETGHTLSGKFQDYWLNNGGLMMFGFPKTEQYQENGFTVQYFERERFEYHPELAGTPWEVELGLLGREVTAGRENQSPFRRVKGSPDSADRRYFPETGHTLAYGFKNYWDNNGSLPMFGFPITEEFTEVSPIDGKRYTVQYFERARFEYHPEFKGTQFEVLLGLLGNQELIDRGWLR